MKKSSHEVLPVRNLIANFIGSGDYANALVAGHHIFTAAHVAQDGMLLQSEGGQQDARVNFSRHHQRDLARSHQQVPAVGYEIGPIPKKRARVTVLGFHGPERKPFRIDAVVINPSAPDGRMIIQRRRGKKFQLGMSGASVIDSQGRVVGILVAGVDGKGGNQVYIEPIMNQF